MGCHRDGHILDKINATLHPKGEIGESRVVGAHVMTKRVDWLHLGRHRNVQGPTNRVVGGGWGWDATNRNTLLLPRTNTDHGPPTRVYHIGF